MNYHEQHPKPSKSHMINRIIQGSDQNRKYLRDENSNAEEHYTDDELNSFKSEGDLPNAECRVKELRQIANYNNQNKSEFDVSRKDLAQLTNSYNNSLTTSDVKQRDKNEEYEVTICDKFGACAILVVTGAVLGKQMGFWGGKSRKSRNNKNKTIKNKRK